MDSQVQPSYGIPQRGQFRPRFACLAFVLTSTPSLALATAAAVDEPNVSEPVRIGEPYLYDFDREQPHVTMKLRLIGNQLYLLRLDDSLESWNVDIYSQSISAIR